jgi:hypothetical protein
MLKKGELKGLPLVNNPSDTSGKLKGLALLAASKEGFACESTQGGVFTLKFLEVLRESKIPYAAEIFEKTKERVEALIVDQKPIREGNIEFSLRDRNNNE